MIEDESFSTILLNSIFLPIYLFLYFYVVINMFKGTNKSKFTIGALKIQITNNDKNRF
jgi:hypothetical protein